MTNKPESAAVEAVAVVMRDGYICWLNSWLMSDNYVKSQQGDKLYPQSALDALRGEVERLRGERSALIARIQSAVTNVAVPKMTESRAEYFKAGARAAIAAVNDALTKESP